MKLSDPNFLSVKEVFKIIFEMCSLLMFAQTALCCVHSKWPSVILGQWFKEQSLVAAAMCMERENIIFVF